MEKSLSTDALEGIGVLYLTNQDDNCIAVKNVILLAEWFRCSPFQFVILTDIYIAWYPWRLSRI
jgi:hypothetical protein